MADEEIYDDGTSISNQTVSGVRNMRAMFETSKTDHPLSRGFSSKPSAFKKDPTPPVEITAKPGATTIGKVPVLPAKVEKTALRPVKPLANVNTAAAASAMRSPPATPLKPTSPRSPPGQDSSGASRSNGAAKAFGVPSSEAGGTTDFRSLLKKTSRPTGPQPVAVASGGSVETKDVGSAQNGVKEEEKKDAAGKNAEEAVQRRTSTGWRGTAVRRSIVTRSHDNKRFRRAEPPSSLPQEPPPTKPPLPTGVDLAPLLQQYKAELARCGAGEGEVEGEMDEVYDDVGVNPADRPVSMLPEMTEEEELGDNPDEVYDDALTVVEEEKAPVDDDLDGETYEPLDDLIQQNQDSGGSADTTSVKSDKEKNDKESAKLKKQEEKERKEREKREKEEKKKMERKKKEERDLRIKFKLQPEGEIETQGEGKIAKDAKGRGLDLAVKAGEKVSIVRMNGNPKGKWLVQNEEGKLGYVDAKLVESMSTVKGGAEGGPKSPPPAANGPSGGGEEEVYDPVDEDIYEEM